MRSTVTFYSNPGRPFCSGVTLAKIAAVTIDEQGNKTFDTSGALDKLLKVSHIFFPLDKLVKNVGILNLPELIKCKHTNVVLDCKIT